MARTCENCDHNEVCEARMKYSKSCNYFNKDRWSGWIPADEEKPKPFHAVLATDGNGMYVSVYRESVNGWVTQFSNFYPNMIAWRELPKWEGSEE